MTPRTKAQNEEIRNRRIAEIIQAAADVYLDKGMLLEIRDVARLAGLGYGTVYHYYKNKIDLLHDLLWQALERSAATVDRLIHESQTVSGGKLPYTVEISGVMTVARTKEIEHKLWHALVTDLLKTWAEDHAAYLVFQLGNEDYRQLPEEQALPLIKAYQEHIVIPLSHLIELGESRAAPGMSGLDAETKTRMLLSAMTGCTMLPLRRGTLSIEAEGISSFLCAGLA
ncbi:helix-turn-helix domain-containing protein [Paenibacillus motobuensis]|uniref:HTH tetR-type domain-containing protein n=1 Tax=Paenibacillus motobuensis TaxID=295324 RepID=A0ABP3IHD2_9BACL